MSTRKFLTHDIPTRKNLRITNYLKEKILDPQNTHEGTMTLGR